MEAVLKKGGLAPVVNGWTLTFHMSDYNVDHLGLGTIDGLTGQARKGRCAETLSAGERVSAPGLRIRGPAWSARSR
jgi:hypothetical protein